MTEQIGVERSQEVAILSLGGQFVGGEETDELRSVLHDLVTGGEIKIIVDVERVTFATSTFLSALLATQTAVARRGGKLMIAGPPPVLDEVLSTTRLRLALHVFSSRAEAMKALTLVS